MQNASPFNQAPAYPHPPPGTAIPPGYQQPAYSQPPPGTVVPPGHQQPAYPQPPFGTGVPLGHQQPGQQIVVQAPIRYGRQPVTMKCFHCGSQIQSSTSSSPGAMGKHLKLSFCLVFNV